jgi:hypothetical protein
MWDFSADAVQRVARIASAPGHESWAQSEREALLARCTQDHTEPAEPLIRLVAGRRVIGDQAT